MRQLRGQLFWAVLIGWNLTAWIVLSSRDDRLWLLTAALASVPVAFILARLIANAVAAREDELVPGSAPSIGDPRDTSASPPAVPPAAAPAVLPPNPLKSPPSLQRDAPAFPSVAPSSPDGALHDDGDLRLAEARIAFIVRIERAARALDGLADGADEADALRVVSSELGALVAEHDPRELATILHHETVMLPVAMLLQRLKARSALVPEGAALLDAIRRVRDANGPLRT